jgi:hypothetical protein
MPTEWVSKQKTRKLYYSKISLADQWRKTFLTCIEYDSNHLWLGASLALRTRQNWLHLALPCIGNSGSSDENQFWRWYKTNFCRKPLAWSGMFPNHVSVSLKCIALNKSICGELQSYLHTRALSICGQALRSTSPPIFLKGVAFAHLPSI